MNPNKALWEKGDFTRIAESMRESGEALVQRIGIQKGMKVLDLGCGDGTTALPAARLGADVLGVDIARNLVDAGNRRAKEHGLSNLRFQQGDASNLHELKDQSFDMVVSIFGMMFAPRPFDVAREMLRVTRPGGRIVNGNWFVTSFHPRPPPDAHNAIVARSSMASSGSSGPVRLGATSRRISAPGAPSGTSLTSGTVTGPWMQSSPDCGQRGSTPVKSTTNYGVSTAPPCAPLGVPAKQVLVHMAIGDDQVPNISTHWQARSMGIPVLGPSVDEPYGLEVTDGPLDGSALVIMDGGAPAIPRENVPAPDTGMHTLTRNQAASHRQIATFFATGQIVNECDGACYCATGACD